MGCRNKKDHRRYSTLNNLRRHLNFAFIPRGPILDIGSGGAPLWRSNILLDRFLADNSQRPGSSLVKDRPLVCGDIHDLPFLDKSMNFVHCAHVLEHVDDPELAIRELMRVSLSGYIETPSSLQEVLILNMSFHRWFVWEDKGVLIFREKSKDRDSAIVDAIKVINGGTNDLAGMSGKIEDAMFVKHFWQHSIPFKVIRDPEPIEPFLMKDTIMDHGAKAEGHHPASVKNLIKKFLQLIYKCRINLLEILACPQCKGRITQAKSSLICRKCLVSYPVIDNVPILLISEGKPLAG